MGGIYGRNLSAFKFVKIEESLSCFGELFLFMVSGF